MPCREKPWRSPGSNPRHQSPCRSEALRFIDSTKSQSTKIDGSLVNVRRRLSNRHGRPRRMLIHGRVIERNTNKPSIFAHLLILAAGSLLATQYDKEPGGAGLEASMFPSQFFVWKLRVFLIFLMKSWFPPPIESFLPSL